MEDKMHSKVIEDMLIPMQGGNPGILPSNSFQSHQGSSKALKYKKITGYHKVQAKETYGMEEKSLIKHYMDETNNNSLITGRESHNQIPIGKLSTASNSKIITQAELNAYHNYSDKNLLHLQPTRSNENLAISHGKGKKLIQEVLQMQNIDKKTNKGSKKGTNLSNFLQMKIYSKLEENNKRDLSYDSSRKKNLAHAKQVQDLSITNLLNRIESIQKISYDLPSSRREIKEVINNTQGRTYRGNSCPKSGSYYLENSHRAGQHNNKSHKNGNDDSELERVTQILVNTSNTLLKKAKQNDKTQEKIEKRDYSDYQSNIMEKYGQEEFSTEYKIEKADDNNNKEDNYALLATNKLTKANQNERKPENNQILPLSAHELTILSLNAEEKEEKRTMFKRDYLIGKEVGRGAYASVRVGLHKPSNMKVAIKVYPKEKILEPNRQKSVRREIKIMERMNHPNIIKIYDTIETRNYVNIIMEYIDGKSLYHFLKAQPQRRIKEKHAFHIFKQLISALDYCHSRCITHRDIKLENVLIDKNANVKLIDYGFTTCFPNNQKVKMFCGTTSYMAPEIVLRKEYYGPPVDIWALGVLLYALLCGELPFNGKFLFFYVLTLEGEDDKKLYKTISTGIFNIPAHISEEVGNLLKKLLSVDPEQRLTTKQVVIYLYNVIHAIIGCE